MASTEDVRRRVLAAIQEKTGGQKPCVVCGHTQWTIVPGFSVFPVSKDSAVLVSLGGNIMPTVGMVCTHCGNTHFMNLLVLGFPEFPSLQIDEDGPAKS